MLGHPLTHGQSLSITFLQRRHVRWRLRGWHAEQIGQHPLAAKYGRCSVRIRRYCENAALAKQSRTISVILQTVLEFDPAKLTSVDIRYPVVFREPFVEVCVICPQKIESAAILMKNAVEKKFGFGAEGLAEVVVKVGEQPDVGNNAGKFTQAQPLIGEVGGERLRSCIGEHAADLAIQSGRIFQLAANRQVEQFIV